MNATVAVALIGAVATVAAATVGIATDEEEPAEAVIYCPDCAEREFGPKAHRST
jgi:hypothetical protein